MFSGMIWGEKSMLEELGVLGNVVVLAASLAVLIKASSLAITNTQ